MIYMINALGLLGWVKQQQIIIVVILLKIQSIILLLLTDAMTRTNPYEVLQLPEDANYEQIKQRYRHLSKLVHPDKHPIENYQIAQTHFKQIDEAYKAISNDLRRYIYKHYGSTGINMIENNPFTFSEFEKADLDDPAVLNKLNQLMLYCLYEEHASNQIDKNVLKTKSILIVSKPLNHVNELPSLQKQQFSFQTSLPDFWGMTHTASVTHASQGLRNQTKSMMVYGVASSKRVNESLMLNVNTQVSSQKLAVEAGIDKIINNNIVLHFIPISYQNGALHPVQIGADFHRNNFYLSGVTDFTNATVQIGSSPANKKQSMMIKFGFDQQALVVSPVFERDLTERVRIFAHLQTRIENTGGNATSLSFGLVYGYRLKLLDQLKLQLASFIGTPHTNFQISILTPKFKANIPIFSKTDFSTFELYKLGTFIGVYLSFELYNYYVKKTERRRKRIQFENYNRISVEKNAVAKNNSDYSRVAEDSREAEVKYEGLVILMAYIGSYDSIVNVKRKVKSSLDIYRQNHEYDEVKQTTTKLTEQIRTNEDDYKEELYNMTDSVQSKVRGAQLEQFNVQKQLGVNPCTDQKQSYYSLTVCYLRHKIIIVQQHSSKPIRIGNLKKRYQKPWYLNVIDYFKNKMVN